MGKKEIYLFDLQKGRSATPPVAILLFRTKFWTAWAPPKRAPKGPRSRTTTRSGHCWPAAAGALIISHATMPNWSQALMTGSFLRNMASMMRMESLMSVSRHTEKSTAFLLMV